MTVRIALVGAGPRNLSVLERLLAGIGPESTDVRITFFDPAPAGAGRIWDPAQPREMLMNSRTAQVTILPDDSVPLSLPGREGLSLWEWVNAVVDGTLTIDLPRDLREECATLRAVSFPSRALYGAYLQWVLARLRTGAPAQCRIEHRRARIVRIDRTSAAGFTLQEPSGTVHFAEVVVLALGWLPSKAPDPPHPRRIAPDNPLDQDLSGIAPGERVLLSGLGMSMTDNLTRLTSGRGGRFDGTRDGALTYIPSGREPHILIGSPSGTPLWPKPELASFPRPHQHRHLRRLLATQVDRRWDFGTEIWPAIVADAADEHLRTLRRLEPEQFRVDQAGTDRLVAELAKRGSACTDELPRLARAALHDPARGLHAEDLRATPPPPTGADYPGWLRARLRRDISEASSGDDSPLVRALNSVSGARTLLIEPLAEDRVTAASRRDEYSRFRSLAPKLGGGPPLARVRQLLALLDQGLVTPLGPGLSIAPLGEHRFRAVDDWGGEELLDHVVDSWLHAPSVASTADPLLLSLREAGWVSEYTAQDDSGTCHSGAVQVDPADLTLINCAGDRVEGLHSLGIPSDGQLGPSVVSPSPHSGDMFLRQTDAAARSVLERTGLRTPRPIDRISPAIEQR